MTNTVTAEPRPDDATTTPEPATPTPEPDSLPIFDTHVHYSQDAWARFAPDEIITILDQADVGPACFTSWTLTGSCPFYARIMPRSIQATGSRRVRCCLI